MTGLTILNEDEYAELSKYDYQFENLVLNGGGTMCIGHIGTLKVFHDLGILPKIKRFAGSSGGAIVAAFAAIGYSPDEIEQKLNDADLQEIVLGRCGGCCKRLRGLFNFWRHDGLLTADGVETWFNELFKEKQLDPNITFLQLYEKTNVELALTASDVARKESVFYHVKTTPDFQIVKAMRQSMSIPLVFTPETRPDDDVGLFVDGGMLNNYPIMCYDGWYLSMEPSEGFLRRYDSELHDLHNLRDARFQGYNKKTVGAMVYSVFFNRSLLTTDLDSRLDGKTVPRPNTTLARERSEKVDDMNKFVDMQLKMSVAMDKLTLSSLEKVPDLRKTVMTLEELLNYRKKTGSDTATDPGVPESVINVTDQKVLNARDRLITELDTATSVLETIKKELKGDKTDDTGASVGGGLEGKHGSIEVIEAIEAMSNFAFTSAALQEAGIELLPSAKDTLAILLILSLKGSTPEEYTVPTKEQLRALFPNYGDNVTVKDLQSDIQLIFGCNDTPEEIFKKNKEISFLDIESNAENKAKNILDKLGITLPPVNQVGRHFEFIFNCIFMPSAVLGRGLMKTGDKDRTIGINTDYIQSLDWALETEDSDFLIKRGAIGTVAFLRNYNEQQQKQSSSSV